MACKYIHAVLYLEFKLIQMRCQKTIFLYCLNSIDVLNNTISYFLYNRILHLQYSCVWVIYFYYFGCGECQ